MMQNFASKSSCRIRDFASMIGSLISVCPAVQYGLLYTKELEREKYLAVVKADGNYTARMKISTHLAEDFQWWIRIFPDFDQARILRPDTAMREIFTDASLTGWGASCDNHCTHGWWSEKERSNHINYLELKAVFYALKCFAADLSDGNILLRVDNTTAISYINRFGSIQHPHLMSLARQIWSWCEERNILLFASYIASIDNSIADQESRTICRDTEWSLSQEAFTVISLRYGPFDVDLFA